MTNADDTHEKSRLAALDALDRLDRDTDERVQRVVRLAKRLFNVPTVAVNLVDSRRLYVAASEGLDARELPRAGSFCAVAVEGEGQLVVSDATRDPRFADAPFVTAEGGFRFYAGQPLKFAGEQVGTLCLMGDEPRDLTSEESRVLRDLGTYLEQEMAHDATQLEAREVQRLLLPRRPPEAPGFEMAGRCLPARDAGGDFFDWSARDDTVEVVLADVMGKGLPAAVVAAGFRALLRAELSAGGDLGAGVSRAAAGIEADLDDSGTFITLIAGRVERATGRIQYVDAGHGSGFVIGPNGVRRLVSEGLPIGVASHDVWHAGEERLDAGEVLVLLSDGVLETFASAEEVLGELERLGSEGRGPDDVVDALSGRAVYARPDDLTVLAVRRSGA